MGRIRLVALSAAVAAATAVAAAPIGAAPSGALTVPRALARGQVARIVPYVGLPGVGAGVGVAQAEVDGGAGAGGAARSSAGAADFGALALILGAAGGVAPIQEPSVLLLDEPSAGLARRESEALGPVLRRIRDVTGAAVVVVEHDMALLRAACDRIVALDAGRVIASGPPGEVLDHPLVVSAYLGGAPLAV